MHWRITGHIRLIHAFTSPASAILPGTIGLSSSLMVVFLTLLYPRKIFLTLGVGLGFGAGIVYVPSIAVTAHHFRRRRAFAMGVAAGGASLGALSHPIMINNLIHGPLGFHNGVRASAALFGGTMLLGGLLTRTNLPPKKDENIVSLWAAAKKFSKDTVYILAVAG